MMHGQKNIKVLKSVQCVRLIASSKNNSLKLHGYTVHQTMLKTFSLPTDAHMCISW